MQNGKACRGVMQLHTRFSSTQKSNTELHSSQKSNTELHTEAMAVHRILFMVTPDKLFCLTKKRLNVSPTVQGLAVPTSNHSKQPLSRQVSS